MNRPRPIDLPLSLPGFFNFFSSWAMQIDNEWVVVDPGCSATISRLKEELQAKGCSQIDHLLLTHIHLDHAGGTGLLVEEFGVSEVVCHEKAIPHLANPSDLWAGSVKTLGDLAEIQGEPKPVPSTILKSNISHVGGVPLTIFPSPGHAPHHISFLFSNMLFVGEALGVIIPEYAPNYLRPATPHRFILEPYLNSIERLRAVPCEWLCFGHFGAIRRSAEIFDRAYNQINLWIKLVADFYHPPKVSLKEFIYILTKNDPMFAPYLTLPESLQMREQRFVENSINGILNFIRTD
jgi:glyoxylase-like metal-dependent hydrolase (beta-lactamase superfamily II)